MMIHHQDHLDRFAAGLSLEWDAFRRAAPSPASIAALAEGARLLRKGKLLKGLAARTRLRRIWVHGVDQNLLHELCALPRLGVLFMEKVIAQDLSVLQDAKALQQLSLDGVPAGGQGDGLRWRPSVPEPDITSRAATAPWTESPASPHRRRPRSRWSASPGTRATRASRS